MKKINYFLLLPFVYLISCSKDAPPAENAVFDRGHDQWYEAVFRFTEGKEIEENGKKYFGTIDNVNKYDLKYPIMQEYIYKYTSDGIVPADDKSILLVKGKAYSLEVFYYNRKNKLMNNEFITPEMAPIHQHYFIPEGVEIIKEGAEKGKKDNIIDYYYRDTKPYDKMLNEKGVSLRGENDPIGLKGYFKVKKAYQKFNLKTILVHIIKGDKLGLDGKPYPFYSPGNDLIGGADLSVKIPIKIFTSIDSPNYKEDISKEFNIPLEEVEKEISEREKLFKESPKVKF